MRDADISLQARRGNALSLLTNPFAYVGIKIERHSAGDI